MSLADTTRIIWTYLVNDAGIIAFFAPASPRIYCPRLPENTTLPAISFLTRGGVSTPYIPGIVTPSVQFDCWAKDEVGLVGQRGARDVYRVLYDALQGIQEQAVTVGVNTYRILSAIEEVQGQDLADVDIIGMYRVLTFFSVMIRAE